MQFYEFLFADESPRLSGLEKEITFRSYDTDGDGYLSFDEFSVAIQDFDESIVLAKKFTSKIDLNGDSRLDLEEFKNWYQVPSKEKIIEEETVYILRSCDANKNGYLERGEVEESCDKLARSQLIINREITAYENKTRLRHDEF